MTGLEALMYPPGVASAGEAGARSGRVRFRHRGEAWVAVPVASRERVGTQFDACWYYSASELRAFLGDADAFAAGRWHGFLPGVPQRDDIAPSYALYRFERDRGAP